MSINQAGGARIYIGSTDAATTLAEFAADSYTEINNVEDLGEFGDEATSITFTSLKDGRVGKYKGPRDAGTMNVVVGDDPRDPGQAICNIAETTKFDYNIKVVLNDAVTLGGNGGIHYFKAKILSARLNVGNVSNVVKRTFAMGVNSAIISSLPT